MNRAVQDDIVAIELFPKSKWSCPSSLALVDDGEKGDDSVQKEVIIVHICFWKAEYKAVCSYYTVPSDFSNNYKTLNVDKYIHCAVLILGFIG